MTQPILPEVKELTLQMLKIEMSGKEEELAKGGVQLNLAELFDAVLRRQDYSQLERLEQQVKAREQELLGQLKHEQPARYGLLEQRSPELIGDLLQSMLIASGVQEEAARAIAKNMGKVASEQIFQVALLFYYGLRAEMETSSLDGLWRQSQE